jgi:hypothetical protein
VWLGLAGNEHQVFSAVWDGNEHPVQAPVTGEDGLPDLEAEGGRGLLLVDNLSTDWGVYRLEDGHGKVVWSVVAAPEASASRSEAAHKSQVSLPRRVRFVGRVVRPVRTMDDLAVLERVRDGLRELE